MATKTKFVQRHLDLPADKIIELAKAQGMSISRALVHVVRSKARKGGKGMSEAEMTRTIRRAGHRPPPPTDKRAVLQRLILQVGLDESTRVLDKVRASLEGMR